MTPELSIIIINYNTFQLTSNCITSVIEKTKEVNFEIILVDNASSECNPDLFLEKFPNINLIKSAENLGFSKGNNLGISKAKGNTILLLNSDIVLKNAAIDLALKKLNAESKIGLITCKLIYPDGRIQHQCRRFDSISMLLIEQLRIHKLYSKEKKAKKFLNGYFDHETEIEVDRIWGAFFMFKREILEMLPDGKLADTFFMYGEDNEWCYQIKKFTPFKILYYPQAEVIHFHGGSIFGRDKQKIILENKFTYMSEFYGRKRTKIYFWLNKVLK